MLTLTASATVGLFYIHRYRFLTIQQFATIAGLTFNHASELLRRFELHGIVGFFGQAVIPGHGKTPKVYFLKRKGWEVLTNESGIPFEVIGDFVQAHQEASWSPQMYHRLRLIDVMLAIEKQVRERPNLNLVETFVEYKRRKRQGRLARETTDYVTTDETPGHRIVPDAAFVLENTETSRRGLFFIELDMATERIVTSVVTETRATLRHKFEQYDRYLTSGRFTSTYKDLGDFRYFTLLFITFGEARINHIRQAVTDLPEELHQYYRFATFSAAMSDFLGFIWKNRAVTDTVSYPLVRNTQARAG